MKNILPFFLIMLSTILDVRAQSIDIKSTFQIDASEVIAIDFRGEDNENEVVLFVNNNDTLIIQDTIPYAGGTDFSVIATKDGEEFIRVLGTKTARDERGIQLLSYSTVSDSSYLLIEYEEALNFQYANDNFIQVTTSRGKSIAIARMDHFDDIWVGNLSYMDSTLTKTAIADRDLVLAGKFRDSLYYDNPLGTTAKYYGVAEENAYIMMLDTFGNIKWSHILDGGDQSEVAQVETHGDSIYFLIHNASRTELRVYDANTGDLLGERFWSQSRLNHIGFTSSSTYLSGWVDTESFVDLDFSEEVEVVLPTNSRIDGVLLSYDADINSIDWYHNIKGEGMSNILEFDISSKGTVYAIGDYSGSSTFDDDIVLDTDIDDSDACVIAYTATGDVEWVFNTKGTGH